MDDEVINTSTNNNTVDNSKSSTEDLDKSVLENSGAFVDFSELDEAATSKNKERKDKIKAEVEKESKKQVYDPITGTYKTKESKNTNEKKKIETYASKKLEESLKKDDTDDKEEETPINNETTEKTEDKVEETKVESKTEEKVVLEEDYTAEKAKTPITEDVSEDELETLVNTQDEKARSRHAIDENDETSPDDFVIDSESKEEIIEEKITDNEDTKAAQDERREKIERALEKRTGYKVYGGENGVSITLASENPNVKNLRNFNIPADKIKPLANDDESLKKAFLDQYITMTNVKDSVAVDHRISRFPLILSGYYAEMTDYSMGDISSVIRVIRNPEFKFARKFQEELVSLYNHISWTSLKPEGAKLTFEEWCKSTKFADLDMFYFGAYDATYPGVGKYDITCGNCGETFRVTKTNRALSYMLQNGNDPVLKDTFIHDVLKGSIPVDELKKTLVYTKANTVWDEKVIKPHNFKIGYKNPTIMDVLEYLSVFEQFLTDDIPDFEALIDDEMQGHNVLTMYTLVNSITVPVNRGKNKDGKSVISFYKVSADVENDEERMNNKRYIVKALSDLPESQFAELFTGKELAERKRLKGIQFILHNIKCENCGSNISRIPIDMRTNFFTRAADTVDKIEQF